MFIQLVRYKIKKTDHQYDFIKKTDLQKYVINNCFGKSYYENIDVVKQIIKFYFTFSTKVQEYKNEYQDVKFRQYLQVSRILKNDLIYDNLT